MGDIPVLLRIIRGEGEPDREPQESITEPQPEVKPAAVVSLPPGERMTWRDGAVAAFAMATWTARQRAKEMAKREGGLVNGLLNAKPPSVAEQCEYAKSKAWVPPGHEGGIADVTGTIYHASIGRFGVAFFDACAGIVARPLRCLIAVLLLAVTVTVVAVWLL